MTLKSVPGAFNLFGPVSIFGIVRQDDGDNHKMDAKGGTDNQRESPCSGGKQGSNKKTILSLRD